MFRSSKLYRFSVLQNTEAWKYTSYIIIYYTWTLTHVSDSHFDWWHPAAIYQLRLVNQRRKPGFAQPSHICFVCSFTVDAHILQLLSMSSTSHENIPRGQILRLFPAVVPQIPLLHLLHLLHLLQNIPFAQDPAYVSNLNLIMWWLIHEAYMSHWLNRLQTKITPWKNVQRHRHRKTGKHDRSHSALTDSRTTAVQLVSFNTIHV